MPNPAPDASVVLGQLDKVLQSPAFQNAERSSQLLRFLVEETLAGRGGQVKEYTVATQVLGRPETFDPRIDSIARVEISRLRNRLEQYYASHGRQDELRILLARGSYVPIFESQQQPESGSLPAAVVSSPPPSRSWQWFAAGCLTAGLCLLGVMALKSRDTSRPAGSAQPPVTLEVELSPQARLANVVGSQMAISPGGALLAFVAAGQNGGSELHIKKLDGSPSTRIPGTEGARNPFFSPDGQWVGFWAAGKIKKVPVTGGAPVVLSDASDLLGGSWGDDGNIIAAFATEAKLWRLPSSGGEARPVLNLSSETLRLMWPQVLPGSQICIYSNVSQAPDSGSVEAVDFRSGKRKTLVRNGTYGRALRSGHLVYVNQGTLYAQLFDAAALEVRGAPVAVAQDVDYSSTFGFAQFDVSDTGTLVFRRGGASGQLTLQRLSRRTGAPRPILTSPGHILWPRISIPDERIAFTRMESGEARVWVIDQAGKAPALPVTPSPGYYSTPVWSPDGRFLIVQGRGTLEWLAFPNPSAPQPLLRGGATVPWSFTPDGRRLAYYQMSPETHFDLWTVPLIYEKGALKAGTPEPFLRTSAVETYPAFSPDGRWMAYVSLRSGTYEVYVRAFPDNGSVVKVSQGGGRLPFWAKGSSEILYETEDHRLMTVRWRVRDGRFEVEPPEQWADVRLGNTGVLANFDLSPDGSVVALLPSSPAAAQPPNQATFRLHFFEELRARIPGSRP